MATVVFASSEVSPASQFGEEVPIPGGTGVAAGDIILLLGATRNSSAQAIVATPGFTQIDTWVRSAISPNIRATAFYKIADGTENGTTIQIGYGNTTPGANSWTAALLVLRGATITGLLEDAANGGTSSADAPSLSPASAGTLIYFGISTSAIAATPTGMTSRASGTAVGSQNHTHRLATEAVGAGATGTRSGALGAALSWLAVAMFVADGGAVYDEAGQGTAIGVGSGADALTTSAAGQGTITATGSGADTLAASDAGQATSAATGSGADSLSAADAGQGTLAAVAGGLDTFVATEAGQGTLAAVGGGQDSAVNVYDDTGGAVSVATAGGLDQLAVSDAGQGTAVARGAGLDLLTMVDAGGGRLVAIGGGADSVPSDVGVLAATLTPRVYAGTLTPRVYAATIAARALPAATLTPRVVTGALTRRTPAATITPRS